MRDNHIQRGLSYMDVKLPDDYIPPRKINNLYGYDLLFYLKYSRINFEKRSEEKKNTNRDQRWHPVMRLVFKLSRMLSGIKVVKINDKLPVIPPDRHVIYTLSHVGKDDQAVFNEIRTKHYSVVSGDYESLYNNVEGLFTKANGVLFFDMNSKEERRTIVNRVAERLSEDDILCSMEGAWNISPNCLVYGIFPGMIKAALMSNAVIIPVGIERFNAKLYSLNVSENYFDPIEERKKFLEEKEFMEWSRDYIRQELASLKYNTYFDKRVIKEITCQRSEIGDFDEYNTWFVNDILKDWTFTEEDINRKRYRDPLEPEIVFGKVIST